MSEGGVDAADDALEPLAQRSDALSASLARQQWAQIAFQWLDRSADDNNA